MEATPLDLAWIAGFVDGEGCFNISRIWPGQRDTWAKYRAQIVIANTDEAVLLEIRRLLGVGAVHALRGQVRGPRSRMCYQFQCGSRDAVAVAGLLLPYLRLKRRQAEVLLQFPVRAPASGPPPPGVQDERRRLWEMLRTLNLRGVPAAAEHGA